ncbi:MAG TPA: hypothetical protein VE010_13620 [Thermoanaerobaculia bacterium]|nr:hypothetical protein [Thermoanaerobaculia bacterium]
MSAQLCPREDELLAAMGRAFIGPELEQHVASCVACSELHLVAGALLDDRAGAMIDAPVPASGTMLWRMRLRQRQEAEATTRRSLAIGQALTLTVAIALVISFFGSDVASGVRNAVSAIRFSTPLLIVVATWLLVAPIAGWVAIRQK